MNKVNLPSATLEELLELYKQSNPEAFKLFFDRTSKLVFNFLCQRMSDRGEAEDVLQETYFRIHKYVGSYATGRNAITWVFSVAKNVMFDHLRRSASHRHSGLSDHDLASPDLRQDDILALQELVQQIFANISPEEQELVLQRIMDGRSYDEIAEDRKITSQNARQKISRLLKRIRAGFSPS